MTTDNRAIREADDLRKTQFLDYALMHVDTWNVTDDKAVYVYWDMDNECVWYVYNCQGLYYSVYKDLDDVMQYIEHGRIEDRWLDLTHDEMLVVDKDI